MTQTRQPAATDFWRQFHATVDWTRKDQTVAGRIEQLSEIRSRDDLVARLKIRADDGTAVLVLATPKRLLAELIRLQPTVGDLITIRYDGDDDRAAPGMRPAKRFTVEVTRQDVEDWWTSNGWKDKAEHDTYRARVKDLHDGATTAQRAAFKAWREAQNIPPFTQPHTRAHADLVSSEILNILNAPPPTTGGVIDELYAKVDARIVALTQEQRDAVVDWAREQGIDGTKKVADLKQDQVHKLDAYLDTLVKT